MLISAETKPRKHGEAMKSVCSGTSESTSKTQARDVLTIKGPTVPSTSLNGSLCYAQPETVANPGQSSANVNHSSFKASVASQNQSNCQFAFSEDVDSSFSSIINSYRDIYDYPNEKVVTPPSASSKRALKFGRRSSSFMRKLSTDVARLSINVLLPEDPGSRASAFGGSTATHIYAEPDSLDSFEQKYAISDSFEIASDCKDAKQSFVASTYDIDEDDWAPNVPQSCPPGIPTDMIKKAAGLGGKAMADTIDRSHFLVGKGVSATYGMAEKGVTATYEATAKRLSTNYGTSGRRIFGVNSPSTFIGDKDIPTSVSSNVSSHKLSETTPLTLKGQHNPSHTSSIDCYRQESLAHVHTGERKPSLTASIGSYRRESLGFANNGDRKPSLTPSDSSMLSTASSLWNDRPEMARRMNSQNTNITIPTAPNSRKGSRDEVSILAAQRYPLRRVSHTRRESVDFNSIGSRKSSLTDADAAFAASQKRALEYINMLQAESESMEKESDTITADHCTTVLLGKGLPGAYPSSSQECSTDTEGAKELPRFSNPF